MGRKAKIVYDSNGKALFQNGGTRVVRVQHDKANDTHILLDGKKKVLSRRSKAEIAYEYYKYIGADTVELTTDERPVSLNSIESGIDGGGDVEITITEDGTITASNVVALSPDVVCSMFAELYYKDPIAAEAMCNIPNLSKLASMDFAAGDKAPKITMNEILEAYITNPNYENKPHSIKEATQYWNEFRTVVNKAAGHKVKYLSDINPSWIKIWEAEINKVATQKSYTKAYWLSSTQRNELGRVKQYPRNNWQRKRVYGVRGLLTHPTTFPNNPQSPQPSLPPGAPTISAYLLTSFSNGRTTPSASNSIVFTCARNGITSNHPEHCLK